MKNESGNYGRPASLRRGRRRFAAAVLAAGILYAARAGGGAGPAGEGAMQDPDRMTDADWKKTLTEEQYDVMRCSATERPFTGKYWNHHGTGVYACAACGQELFRSSEKFDSGTGWPGFWRTAAAGRVIEKADTSHGMRRVEVVCSRCGGHLGHVFEDGPQPTGMRYCINSAALEFSPAAPPASGDPRLETATFGAGCFWCSEAAFDLLEGVREVKVGYMGGTVEKPTYKQVSRGDTGHAEVAQVTYDPARVSFDELLHVFWKIHDPTTLNRQGADVGTQYRSVVFYHSDEQKRRAEASAAKEAAKLGKKVVTQIAPAAVFYPAEDYHQEYFKNNPAFLP